MKRKERKVNLVENQSSAAGHTVKVSVQCDAVNVVQYITGQEPVTVQLGRTNLLIHLKLFLSYRKSNLRDHHQPIWTLIFQLKWIDEFIWPELPQNFVPPLPVEAPIDVNQPSMSKIEDTEMVVDAEPLSVEARYSDNVDDEGYIKVGSKRKN